MSSNSAGTSAERPDEEVAWLPGKAPGYDREDARRAILVLTIGFCIAIPVGWVLSNHSPRILLLGLVIAACFIGILAVPILVVEPLTSVARVGVSSQGVVLESRFSRRMARWSDLPGNFVPNPNGTYNLRWYSTEKARSTENAEHVPMTKDQVKDLVRFPSPVHWKVPPELSDPTKSR